MRVVVTGGLGFIGSHLVDLLIGEGWDVTIVDDLSTGRRENHNPKAKVIEEDIMRTEPSVFQDAEYVFHMAALPRIQPSFDDPVSHERGNVLTTVDLLLKLRGNKRLKKLIFSSSSAVYGNPCELPTSETSPPAPLSPYALQKYTAEQYVLILGERYRIPVMSLRYFNVYGPRSFHPANPRNAYSSVLGIFAKQRKKGEQLTITGDGSQERDFIHVRDVAQANMLAAMSSVQGEVYNIGSGRTISVLELAKLFQHPYRFIPERQGEARVTWANIEKIERALGWQPTISLAEGIRELCAE